jgi:hypothetical protein
VTPRQFAGTPPPPITVNGKVTNIRANKLFGATVTEELIMLRQQKKMAVFLYVASEKSVLVISYVGFDNQEIVVGSKTA